MLKCKNIIQNYELHFSKCKISRYITYITYFLNLQYQSQKYITGRFKTTIKINEKL